MAKTAPQIGEVLVGETINVAIDCSGFLDDGETLSGTPTVVEQSTELLQISSQQVNVSELTINGVTVAAGYAVQCSIDAANATAGDYTLLVTFSTTASQTRKGLVQLSVVS